jgi:hypothetical protein
VKIVAYVPDLMDRSKVPATVFVRDPADLAAHVDADVYVVDLGRPGVLDAIGSLAGRHVVGFASHVDGNLIAAARAAGVAVYRRSEFFRDPQAALGGTSS